MFKIWLKCVWDCNNKRICVVIPAISKASLISRMCNYVVFICGMWSRGVWNVQVITHSSTSCLGSSPATSLSRLGKTDCALPPRDNWELLLASEVADFIKKIFATISIKWKSLNNQVFYSNQGSHTGKLDFCDWLVDGSTTGIMWLSLRSVKSININFLNQIHHLSMKLLPSCPHEAGWIPFQTWSTF